MLIWLQFNISIRGKKLEIKSEDIVRIGSYMSIIHHTKGRLRVRVDPKIQDEAGNIKLEDIKELPDKIEGINKIKR